MKVTLNCCLCETKTEHEFAMPDGWQHRYDGLDDDKSFCPDHAAIAAFAEAQCPGCVGGWGDCDLWRAFAYERQRTITDADLSALRTGICPRRTNGTFSVSGRGGIKHIDLSERAADATGTALADAIIAYMARYPERVSP